MNITRNFQTSNTRKTTKARKIEANKNISDVLVVWSRNRPIPFSQSIEWNLDVSWYILSIQETNMHRLIFKNYIVWQEKSIAIVFNLLSNSISPLKKFGRATEKEDFIGKKKKENHSNRILQWNILRNFSEGKGMIIKTLRACIRQIKKWKGQTKKRIL